MKYLCFIILTILIFSCEKDDNNLTCLNSFENSSKINGINVYSSNLNPANNTNIIGNSIALTDIIWAWTNNDNSIEIKDFQTNDTFMKFENSINQISLSNHQIMLRPLINFSGTLYRGDFYLVTEEQWQIFENSYKTFILSIAELSNTYNIHSLCIGTELREFVSRRPLFWKGLIEILKENYPTLKLIYAANWDDYEAFPFWEEMEYIGIDSYFPLVNKSTPTVDELMTAYNSIKNNLYDLSCSHNKKVIFTEYGFRSIDYAAWKTWELPSSSVNNTYNFTVQSNGYKAFYDTFWNENWVAGGYLWFWDVYKTELSNNPMFLNDW